MVVDSTQASANCFPWRPIAPRVSGAIALRSPTRGSPNCHQRSRWPLRLTVSRNGFALARMMFSAARYAAAGSSERWAKSMIHRRGACVGSSAHGRLVGAWVHVGGLVERC